MNKGLREIDPIYNDICEYMSLKEKITYCTNLITKTKNFLKAEIKDPNNRIKKKYEEIIKAAQAELDLLEKSQP